ncbi:MAG: NAD(P)-dependent oxidoreductase [Spirochaetales bacterium]
MDKKTIWINLDSQKVNLEVIEDTCMEKGYNLIEQDIPSEESLTVEMALKADAIISSAEPWNENTLSKIAGMGKFIMRYGVGTDNIDIPTATKYKIPVANLPGANATTVAEIALLHILNIGRFFYHEVHDVKNKSWSSDRLGSELDGKVLGLIGYGNIARQLSRLVSGFDITVIACDPFVNNIGIDFAKKYNVNFVSSMENIFSTADIISLHIPLNNQTRGLINKNYFNMMKPTASLVNTCRGGVIHEEDLIDALKNNKIKYAGLDVLSQEPPQQDNPLLSMSNVYITPHIASNTYENGVRSQKIMMETIESYFNGELTDNVLNKKDLCI